MISKKGSNKRKLTGVVVSDKMDKTVVVEVKKIKTNPVYKKQYRVTKKYKAHDEKNVYKIGDSVIIVESRPISKHKRWTVEEKRSSK